MNKKKVEELKEKFELVKGHEIIERVAPLKKPIILKWSWDLHIDETNLSNGETCGYHITLKKKYKAFENSVLSIATYIDKKDAEKPFFKDEWGEEEAYKYIGICSGFSGEDMTVFSSVDKIIEDFLDGKYRGLNTLEGTIKLLKEKIEHSRQKFNKEKRIVEYRKKQNEKKS